MARFTSNPLKSLDAIYKFYEGLTGLKEFQLEGAIIPVHDLSREAEVGSGLSQAMGFFLVGTADVHAGAGVIRTTHDPWAQVDTQVGSGRRSQHAVWLIDVFGTSSVQANFQDAGANLTYPTIPDAFAAQNKVIAAFDTTVATAIVAAVFNLEDTNTIYRRSVLPLFIPDGSTMALATQAQIGAATISLTLLYWAGAVNTLPPGVA